MTYISLKIVISAVKFANILKMQLKILTRLLKGSIFLNLDNLIIEKLNSDVVYLERTQNSEYDDNNTTIIIETLPQQYGKQFVDCLQKFLKL